MAKKHITDCYIKWAVLFLKQQGFSRRSILNLFDGKEFNRKKFPRDVTDGSISKWMSDVKEYREKRKQCIEDFLDGTSEQERERLLTECRKVAV
jgi:hypothetical protein